MTLQQYRKVLSKRLWKQRQFVRESRRGDLRAFLGLLEYCAGVSDSYIAALEFPLQSGVGTHRQALRIISGLPDVSYGDLP